jgi:O-antigen/teichoic acid export membrane protein
MNLSDKELSDYVAKLRRKHDIESVNFLLLTIAAIVSGGLISWYFFPVDQLPLNTLSFLLLIYAVLSVKRYIFD